MFWFNESKHKNSFVNITNGVPSFYKYSNLKKNLYKNSLILTFLFISKFEELAVNVMDECYKTDETFAEKLIMCPSKHWGGKNVLTMASDSDNKVRG